MQDFLSLWLNAGAQITHGGQVQRPRQKYKPRVRLLATMWVLIQGPDLRVLRKTFFSSILWTTQGLVMATLPIPKLVKLT